MGFANQANVHFAKAQKPRLVEIIPYKKIVLMD